MAKSPNILNLEMTRGDTKALSVEIVGFNGDLQTAFLSCRVNQDDESYVFQKSLGNGITKIGTGKYSVKIAPADTNNLELGTYYYDLEIGMGGDIHTIAKGKLEITYDVTREA